MHSKNQQNPTNEKKRSKREKESVQANEQRVTKKKILKKRNENEQQQKAENVCKNPLTIGTDTTRKKKLCMEGAQKIGKDMRVFYTLCCVCILNEEYIKYAKYTFYLWK